METTDKIIEILVEKIKEYESTINYLKERLDEEKTRVVNLNDQIRMLEKRVKELTK